MSDIGLSMDNSALKATHARMPESQETTALSELAQPHYDHELGPKRKQYQSCDYCRKRRRPCNAVSLGINPFAQEQESTKKLACTTCFRVNRTCTFNWLQNLPGDIPQGVKSRLAVLGRRATKAPDLPQSRKRRHDSGSPSYNYASERTAASDRPTESATLREDSSGQRVADMYKTQHLEPINLSSTYSSAFRDSSLWHQSDQNDLIDLEDEDGEYMLGTPQIAHSSSFHYRPVAMPLARPVHNESVRTSHSSAMPLLNNDEKKQATAVTELEELGSTQELERIQWRSTPRAKTWSKRGRGERGSSHSTIASQYPPETSLYRYKKPSFLPDFELAEASIKSFYVAGLKQIYRNSMETALSCWLTMQNSPYERRMLKLKGGPSTSTASSESKPTTLYDRARYLDTAFSVLRDDPLTKAENASASEVLKLAMLAFSSQWSSSSTGPSAGSSSRRNGESLADDGGDFDRDFLADSNEIEDLIRQSLWTQLNNSLTRLSNCNSFQVIAARLILFFVSKPLNMEEKEFIQNVVSSDRSQTDARSHANVVPKLSGNVQSTPPQSFFSLLVNESRTDHLRTALEHLSSWSGSIKTFLRQPASSRTVRNTQTEEVRQQVLRACPHFNLLYWFAVMIDTARATLYNQPLIFLDYETELYIVKHSSEETPFFEDASQKGNVFKATTTASDDSEIWRPLRSKPSYPCDNPFKDSRTQFMDRIARVLREAKPTSILILRKVAHLQAAISARSTAEKVEHCITEVLDVYQEWDVRYHHFLNSCMSEHSTLPFTIRSWYLTVFGHWFVGCLKALQVIDEYDTQANPNPNNIRQALRLSTSVILQLQKEGSYKFAEIMRRSCLDNELNAIDRSNQHYHSNLRPGTLLTEPGPDIMVSGLRSACDIMLTWFHILQAPTVSLDTRDIWVQCHVNTYDLTRYVTNCIDAMTQLGHLSSFAKINAKVYRDRLDALRKKSLVSTSQGDTRKQFAFSAEV